MFLHYLLLGPHVAMAFINVNGLVGCDQTCQDSLHQALMKSIGLYGNQAARKSRKPRSLGKSTHLCLPQTHTFTAVCSICLTSPTLLIFFFRTPLPCNKCSATQSKSHWRTWDWRSQIVTRLIISSFRCASQMICWDTMTSSVKVSQSTYTSNIMAIKQTQTSFVTIHMFTVRSLAAIVQLKRTKSSSWTNLAAVNDSCAMQWQRIRTRCGIRRPKCKHVPIRA